MNRNSGCLKLTSALVILALLASILYPLLVRPWHLSWGSTSAEQQAALPGDEFVPDSVRTHTRAITIEAPVEQVWPWVIQLGADRGGLYSYAWLEALIACPIENSSRIHPEWQQFEPGDLFRLCPGEFGPPPYEVIAVEPGRALVVGHPPYSEADRLVADDWYDSWAFVVQPFDTDTTRLLVRNRTAELPGWMLAIEPGAFIMERGLMIGLKARAEGRALDPSAEALYKLMFGLLLAGFLAVRFTPQRSSARAQAIQTPPAQTTVERIFTWAGWLVLVPVVIYPLFNWLDALHLPFPNWLRWLGGLVFLLGDLLFYWTRRTLGRAWSGDQGVDQEAAFVSSGPYRRIRHPMYASMFLITIGMSLLAANLLVGLPYLLLVWVMYARWVEVEEAELQQKYGAAYGEYMQLTGRLVPKMRIGG